MRDWLDGVMDRWSDDPRSDAVTFAVGVSAYFLFWASLAGVAFGLVLAAWRLLS